MKTETWLLLLAGWYFYSKSKTSTSIAPLPKSYVCFAQDGSRFPFPNSDCPYADYVYQDVAYYVDATGNDIRVN